MATPASDSSRHDLPIDLRRLDEWMTAQGLPPGEISDIESLGGGTQNLLLRFTRGSESYVMRHPPLHKRENSDETMRREARVLASLAGTDVPHARLIAACGDSEVLGSAFYLMDPVEGANPTITLPAGYAGDSRWRHQLGLEVVDAAAAIGAVDHVLVELGDFGRPDGFIERQVPRWQGQLESYSELPGYEGPALPDVDKVASWLESNQPTSWIPGLMHGDLHLGNVMCHHHTPGVAALVDWELSTIGDPLVDLGWLLATWPDEDGPVVGSVQVHPWDGFPRPIELVERYSRRSQRDLSSITWYEVLACYKLAIILEGTHARACAGLAPPETGDMLHESAVALLNRAGARIRSV